MDNIIPTEVSESSHPVAIFGYAHPRTGQEESLTETLLSFVAPTRQEAGSVAYHVHDTGDGSGTLAFYEQWASGPHLRRHLERPEMQAFLARRMELLSEDLRISFFRPISPGGRHE